VAVVLPVRFTVCGFAEIEGSCDLSASHVLSLLDPGIPAPPELDRLGSPNRVELRFHDVIETLPQTQSPAPEDVEQILALGRELALSRPSHPHLLIHCHAGFSRSPAALALLVAQTEPSFGAEAIAAEVLRIRPNAWPNLRIIELGGQLLDRRGQLVEAAARIYRKRLVQDPSLAELMRENNRLREVEAGRRLQTSPVCSGS
jgi:predicted protein tyrosine phosphatase